MAFSGFAEVVQPPTDDQELVLDAIRSLTTGRRTAIGSGLLAATNAIAEIDPSVARVPTDGSPFPSIPPVPKGAYAPDIIVLLTDGVNNAGPLPVDAANLAADRGVRVYIIGYGTAEGAPLDTQCASQFLGNEPFLGGGPGGGFTGGSGRFRRASTRTRSRRWPPRRGQLLQRGVGQRPAERLRQAPHITDPEARGRRAERGLCRRGRALAVLALLLARVWRPLP